MVSHRFGRNRSHPRMSLHSLLWIVLVASSPCDHVVARTDELPNDRDVSFRRQRRHLAEERPEEPPLRGEGRFEEGENDEYENDSEETITDGEPYREEQTRDYAYRYDRGNEDEYQESPNTTTTTIPDVYDPDETDPNYVPLQEEIPERSIDASSSSSFDNSPKSTWIAHGTLGALSFGLLVPLAVSSALFRDLFPSYWIYIHVFFNVAVFAITLLAVGVAFAAMHSLGDANEGHWKERHHIVGLGVLLLVTFQTANGFLRPPREFVDEEENDEEEEGEGKVSPRAVWRRMHRATGLGIVALGTWQVRSGMEIFARKFGTADWGGVYLGYMGWVVLVMGGGKMWMKVREKKGIGKNEWNAEDELFDTDGLRRGLEDD